MPVSTHFPYRTRMILTFNFIKYSPLTSLSSCCLWAFEHSVGVEISLSCSWSSESNTFSNYGPLVALFLNVEHPNSMALDCFFPNGRGRMSKSDVFCQSQLEPAEVAEAVHDFEAVEAESVQLCDTRTDWTLFGNVTQWAVKREREQFRSKMGSGAKWVQMSN